MSGPWHGMQRAPKDGTVIEILFRHENWNYAEGAEKERWEEVCDAQWINHNGGGWTWCGICGAPVMWRPKANKDTSQG